MTRTQLARAVAGATGESPRTILALGFQAAPAPPRDLPPEDLCLAVDCPFCGRPARLPAKPAGAPPLAECDRCDVVFDHSPDEVYAASERAFPAPSSSRRAGCGSDRRRMRP
jgi:hypothetical protein